jgi:hypothetical protein
VLHIFLLIGSEVHIRERRAIPMSSQWCQRGLSIHALSFDNGKERGIRNGTCKPSAMTVRKLWNHTSLFRWLTNLWMKTKWDKYTITRSPTYNHQSIRTLCVDEKIYHLSKILSRLQWQSSAFAKFNTSIDITFAINLHNNMRYHFIVQ